MSTVPEIKQSILNLPRIEFAEIIEWLYEMEETEWDQQIEADAAARRLDVLKAEAQEAKGHGTTEYSWCTVPHPSFGPALVSCPNRFRNQLVEIS